MKSVRDGINVCWNNVYRIVFGMHKWESVKGIQWYCERFDCIRFTHNLKLKFYSCLCWSPNNVVSRCFNWFLYSNEFLDLYRNYDVTVQPSSLKFNVFNQFYYPRDAMLARVIVIATCPSGRLSRAGILSKRRKLAA